MSLLTVQRKLLAAGFDPGPLDGAWGRKTEATIDHVIDLARQFRPIDKPIPANVRDAALVDRIVSDGLRLLWPVIPDTEEARVMLLAISGQEADFTHRWQVFDRKRPDAMGAARGLWQFERGGGVKGVLTHERTKALAANVCRLRGVTAMVDAVYNRLHADDVLAAAFARLNLWWHPKPLPAVGDVQAAFDLYIDIWRPGAWARGNTTQKEQLRRKWAGYYADALAARKTK